MSSYELSSVIIFSEMEKDSSNALALSDASSLMLASFLLAASLLSTLLS